MVRLSVRRIMWQKGPPWCRRQSKGQPMGSQKNATKMVAGTTNVEPIVCQNALGDFKRFAGMGFYNLLSKLDGSAWESCIPFKPNRKHLVSTIDSKLSAGNVWKSIGKGLKMQSQSTHKTIRNPSKTATPQGTKNHWNSCFPERLDHAKVV